MKEARHARWSNIDSNISPLGNPFETSLTDHLGRDRVYHRHDVRQRPRGKCDSCMGTKI
jgi:hypothetical protein